MNLIKGPAVVSCLVDIAALLIVLILLMLSQRVRRRMGKTFNLFFALCIQIALTCIVCFVFNACEGHTSQLSHIVALISMTLWDICAIVTVVLWLAYVDQKLYGDLQVFSKRHIARLSIVLVYVILFVINLFTGFLFRIGTDNSIIRTRLYYVLFVLDFALFLSASVAVVVFDRRSSKIRFLRVSPMVLPIFIATIPQFFTFYNTGIMGYVIGLSFLYISLVSEQRFIDGRSGLYNPSFMSVLFETAIAEKDFANSVLIMEAQGNLDAACRLLKDVLHRTGDVIRLEERKFIMFLKADNISAIQFRVAPLDVAVDKYNTQNPEDKVSFSVRSKLRSPDESSFNFLRTSMEEDEGGNEMRGIVSMITELDRLDKELSMAAEIQASNLPMNFPPFPDRHEFELFASMSPAKEVGGDFYDFFLIDDDHLALVIADVSGKGIPAALFMMVSKTLIKNNLMSGCSPAHALAKTNNQLYEHNTFMMFVTVWAAVIEISTGKGTAVNAGHEKTAYGHDGSFVLLDYDHDVCAGIVPDLEYHDREFTMEKGDVILVYTDGVLEATNAKDEQYGEERLLEALNGMRDATTEAIVGEVHWKVNEFVGDADQFDDLTMLCFKFYGDCG
ncbi:MAG: PP2C family protein-serine/threonine phosphatase [Butyrivibrio sp.]|nr:PP2C family protein-serine/threonine phosphatase [Butyrivibrio sp.]